MKAADSGAMEASIWKKRYEDVRNLSLTLCQPLETEDFVVQPIVEVSPPKWHLGHTTWFFETFVLIPYANNYQVFNTQYNYLFNSYYEGVGRRIARTQRGNLSRPTVAEVYTYREYVDSQMQLLLNNESLDSEIIERVELGLNHEQQHQELLISDIKYILGHQPLFPVFQEQSSAPSGLPPTLSMISIPAGTYQIGHEGEGFYFDNERARHRVHLEHYGIANRLTTNQEYLEFMEDGGYRDFTHWHADGWDWVKNNKANSPLYWHHIDGQWAHYTLEGLRKVDLHAPVCHINYYEASAFATWKGMRLPTEAEWEIANEKIQWGQRWEWTESAYLPYPAFQKVTGVVGEYNAKFMVNQLVLRGASSASSPGHSRATYRNFLQAWQQWQFTGVRLAQ